MPVRASLVIWGGWLVVTAATFSFMAGIFHAYYTVALAPAIGALVGTGAWLLWQHRTSLLASGVASAAVSLTTVLSFFLLGRTSDFLPWLRWVVLLAGLVIALAVAGLGRLPRRIAAGLGAAALVVSLAGPAAYAVETAATPHTGSIPSAGPATSGGFGGGGPGGAPPGMPTGTQATRQQGAGGLLDGSESTDAITALLQEDADQYTWVAAAVGSNSASGYQLASEEPVMAIGGFNGSDPSPTLAQFQAYVAAGEIHYFIAGGGFGGGRRRQPDGRQQRQQRHRRLGGRELHRDHGRRRHALRPDQHHHCHRRDQHVSAAAYEPLAEAVATTTLDVVIPVYNEEDDLEASVLRVRDQLARLPWSHRITIADNASTDGTAVLARRLAHTYDGVRVVHLAEKGRGRALKKVWADSDADVLVYMDVDLSTDLNALLPLVAPLISGHSDLAIGSRLRHDSRVVRGPKREVISRGYNLLVKGALRTRFSDAQCGFKAIRRDVAREVLPLVEDDAWFFDTELLVLAERAGLRIHEVPVDWVDDSDSRVDIARTAYDDVRGILRLGRNLLAGRLPLADVSERLGRASADAGAGRLGMQVAMFGLVGIASTVAYAGLYLLLRGWTGAWTANALALLLTAIGNTAANRRLTFGVRGRRDVLRHQAQGLLVFGIGLAVTSGALWVVHAAGSSHHGVEVAVLTVANLAVTVMRFVAMRAWMFVHRRR